MHHARRNGYSVLELVFATGLIVTVGAVTVPNLIAGLDEYRAAGAARYVSTRLQRARMEAVLRSRAFAVRFTPGRDGRYAFAAYVDGNHNGILTSDIERGIDEIVGPPEYLANTFAGIEFGALSGLPAVDSNALPPGSDPIRLGPGNFATFTPLGTCTPGSVYIRGRNAQYAVRLLGETGKTRVLKFNTRTQQWKPL
jgi:hypothetical protein